MEIYRLQYSNFAQNYRLLTLTMPDTIENAKGDDFERFLTV
jgi:hypothetical protein